MLKTVTVIILLALCSRLLAGENFGFKAGATFAHMNSDYHKAGDRRLGLTIGVFLDLKIDDDVYIQPEITFAPRGAKYKLHLTDDEGNVIQGENWEKYDYFQLPVLLKYKIDFIINSVYAGPYIAYLEDAEWEFESDYEEIPNIVNVSDETESIDYGFVVGIEQSFKTLYGKFNIDLRYSYGLRDIWIPDNLDAKNNAITFSLGMFLN